MAVSYLQDAFLSELAANFAATQRRIVKRLGESKSGEQNAREAIVSEELRGLYHGVLVIFDGGTALADQGLLKIVDEDGVAFQRSLHEKCFDYWK